MLVAQQCAGRAEELALAPRQAAFVREYLVDLNGTQAAIRAGYSPATAESQASRLLSNAKVKAAVELAMEARSRRVEVTADYVLRNLVEVVDRCMQRAPVMVREEGKAVQAVDEDGNHIWEFNANGANKALELLGKHKKLFTDRVEHGLADMTDEQLERRFREITTGATSATKPPESGE